MQLLALPCHQSYIESVDERWGGKWEETLNRAEGRQGVDDVSFSEEEMRGWARER